MPVTWMTLIFQTIYKNQLEIVLRSFLLVATLVGLIILTGLCFDLVDRETVVNKLTIR